MLRPRFDSNCPNRSGFLHHSWQRQTCTGPRGLHCSHTHQPKTLRIAQLIIVWVSDILTAEFQIRFWSFWLLNVECQTFPTFITTFKLDLCSHFNWSMFEYCRNWSNVVRNFQMVSAWLAQKVIKLLSLFECAQLHQITSQSNGLVLSKFIIFKH